MDVDEFNAMMEDEGEEVGLNVRPSNVAAPLAPPPPPPPPLSTAPDLDLDEQGHRQGVDSFEDDIETEFGPTQSDESGKVCPPTFPFRSCVQLYSVPIVRHDILVDDRRSGRCLMTELAAALSRKPQFCKILGTDTNLQFSSSGRVHNITYGPAGCAQPSTVL
jgi:hypothetical protein